MQVAILLSMLPALLVAFLLPLLLSGKQFSEAEEKARARRLTDARMNARLLRLNL